MNKNTIKIITAVAILIIVFFVGRYSIKKADPPQNQNGEPGAGQAAGILPVAKEQKITETVGGIDVNVSYPVFTNVPKIVNEKIKEYIDERIKNIKDIASDGTVAENADLFLTSTYEVAQANDKYVSFVESSQEYTGGAHGNQYFATFNFETSSGVEVKLADLFSNKNYLDTLKPKVKTAVLAELQQRLDDEKDRTTDPASLLFDDIMTLPATAFEIFTFGEKYITFYFAPYDIAPYSTGPIVVKIDR